MKKLLLPILCSILMVGCGNGENEKNDTNNQDEEKVKVGLVVTHDEAIEDRSFIEGTWNGMQKNADSLGQEVDYIVSSSRTTPDYETAINTFIDTGYETIVLVGYEFLEAIDNSSKANPDVEYIIIDEYVEGDNIKSIIFKEEEGGFIGGLTAALTSETGKVGFVGGMAIPPVERYAIGFEAGLKYAKEELGINLEEPKIIYEGSFDNVPGGATIAAGMYDQDVDVIMHAAGGVGIGVINEAMEREGVWVIGVDIDQFDLGKRENGTSVILTSAMKNLDIAVGEVMKELSNGQYKGGESYLGNIENGGISLPTENPNLDNEVENQVKEIMESIVSGEIVVPNDKDSLDSFLN